MNKLACIDIFTTQNDLFGKHNCPVQFSYQVFDESDIYDKGKFILNPENSNTINIIPDEDMSMAGYRTTGMNDDYIKSGEYNGVELSQALENIYGVLTDFLNNGYYIMGYNHVKYDLDILNSSFERVLQKSRIDFPKDKIIDVMEFAENIISVTKCGNYATDSVFLALTNDLTKLETLKSVKSTLTDMKLTKLILMMLLNKISTERKFTCSEIVTIIDKLKRKVNRFNFGKYKGLTLEEVFKKDTQYVSWLLKHTDKQYLTEKLRAMMNNMVQ